MQAIPVEDGAAAPTEPVAKETKPEGAEVQPEGTQVQPEGAEAAPGLNYIEIKKPLLRSFIFGR